jgi:hypothetical protein
MPTVVKYREMLVQVLLMIITLGLYSIYWFYQTANELKAIAGDAEAVPALWTVLLLVPFGAIYSFYKYGELYERAAEAKVDRWVLFLLWMVFCPAVWFIVQIELNKRALATAGQTV